VLFTFIVDSVLVCVVPGELEVLVEECVEVDDAIWVRSCVFASDVSVGDVGRSVLSGKGVPHVYDKAAYFGLFANALVDSVQHIGL
jgi:hypothetical protein